MSDKRRRYRKTKDERPHKATETEVKPKILLKPRVEEKKENEGTETTSENQVPQKTIIATRSDASSLATTSNVATQQLPSILLSDSVAVMTRPATILSSTGVVSSNVKKLLSKENTDFYVVGVIGTQGVGKSTILNMLANEDPAFDYYQHLFVDEEGFFPTKLKQHKCPSRSRTESTHMFITKDRVILLDMAPVMCNSYKKDMTTNELDDLRSIINFLSVCHCLLIIQDDYFNLNFLRLLRLAELMKPPQGNGTNSINSGYYPNLLFVKNRAKRRDFGNMERRKLDSMLETFFKDSKMRIYRGQTAADQQLRTKKSHRTTDGENVVNSFVFPEVITSEAVPYHKPLIEIINDLRWIIFSTPRSDMHTRAAEFTETAWFELFEKVSQTMQHFFYNTYDEIHRSHLDTANSSSNVLIVNGNVRDSQD